MEENGFGHSLTKKGACGNGPAGGKRFLTKNVIFDQKKAPAATGQQEENGFSPKMPSFTKKGARGNATAGGKWFLTKNTVLIEKSACGNGPAGGKWFLTKNVMFDKKEAPAATGQQEENGF